MITSNDKQTQLIEEYTRNHNVAMLALSSVLSMEDKRSVVDERHIEDIKTGFEVFLYDINSIHNQMVENMELLWELKADNK